MRDRFPPGLAEVGPLRAARHRGHTWWSGLDRTSQVLLVLRVVIVIAVAIDTPDWGNTTTERYRVIAAEPGTPYRDFSVEYAPGELLVALSVGSGSAGVAVAGLAVLAFLADMMCFAALSGGWGAKIAARYLWLGTPMLVFMYRRTDLIVVALTVCAVWASRRGRGWTGGCLFVASILTRFWPAVLLPVLFIERRRRALGVALAGTAAGSLTWAAIAGPDAIRQVATFRGATGFEVESSVGVIVWALTGVHRDELDANRTGSIPGWFSPVTAIMLTVALASIWIIAARRRDNDAAGAPSLAAVATILVLAPVFSPQYVAWLVPWASIASADARRLSAMAVVPVVITSFLMLAWSTSLGLGPGWTQILLLSRNLAVLAIPLGYIAPFGDWRPMGAPGGTLGDVP